MISKHILYITCLNEPKLKFMHTVKWFLLFFSYMNAYLNEKQFYFSCVLVSEHKL